MLPVAEGEAHVWRGACGIAGIEMLASGLPIVASRIQGIKDFLKEGEVGFGSDPDDVDGFVEGINKLSDSSLREEMSKNCVRVAMQFDRKISNEQMLRIYNSILPDKDKIKMTQNKNYALFTWSSTI